MQPQSDYNTFQALTEIPRPSDIVPLPRKLSDGKEPEVSMQILTMSEMMACKADAEIRAQKWLKDHKPEKGQQSIGYEELYRDMLAVNTVWFATRMKHDLTQKFFPTKEAITDNFTPDEIGILMNHYYTIQLYKGPVIADLDQKEIEIWIDRLVKDGSTAAFFFNSFTLEMLKSLLITMASQLRSLQMDNSSHTLQQEPTKPIQKNTNTSSKKTK